MRSTSEPSTWTLIPWEIHCSIVCSCSSDKYILLRLLCLRNSGVPQYIATHCIASCVLSSNALKSFIIASGSFPSRRFWAPWILALHMTGSTGRQLDQHWKGGLCRRQHWSPDAKRELRHLALWFRSRECDTPRWILAASRWDCDWRRYNRPWVLFYVLVHISQQNTVARLWIDKSVRPNETSSGSLESWSRHATPSKHLSCGWYNRARHSFRATSWTGSKCQHLFPRPPFDSSRVTFSGYWLWPSPVCRLAWLRKHLWTCEHNARRPPCSSKLHHREIYIEHTYRVVTTPVRTPVPNWIWDAEQGFRLVETGLQLQAGRTSFLSSPSQSI